MAKKRRIAILMEYYLPTIGGAQICAHSLAKGLVDEGHEVTVYAGAHHLRACEKKGWEFTYKTRKLNSRLLYMPSRFPTLGRWVCALYVGFFLRWDRIHVAQAVMMVPWIGFLRELKWVSGIPFVFRAGGDDVQVDPKLGYGLEREKQFRRLRSSGYAHVDHAIAISSVVSEAYERLGIPSSRITEIPPGVSGESYTGLADLNRSKLRVRWGLPQDKKILIAVGRNHQKKGFRYLAQALDFLPEEYVALFVGKGTAELKEANPTRIYSIEELSNSSNASIDSLPSREILELYRLSDSFVYPSLLETYANVALEAMAAGLPVITTRAPGCLEAIRDGVDGLLVAPESAQELAQAVLRLDGDPGLRQSLVEAGRERAREQDWAHINVRYSDVYDRVLG